MLIIIINNNNNKYYYLVYCGGHILRKQVPSALLQLSIFIWLQLLSYSPHPPEAVIWFTGRRRCFGWE